jgi:hypothetical protein
VGLETVRKAYGLHAWARLVKLNLDKPLQTKSAGFLGFIKDFKHKFLNVKICDEEGGNSAVRCESGHAVTALRGV